MNSFQQVILKLDYPTRSVWQNDEFVSQQKEQIIHDIFQSLQFQVNVSFQEPFQSEDLLNE